MIARFDGMRAFAEVALAGSFATAARRLGLLAVAVSRRARQGDRRRDCSQIQHQRRLGDAGCGGLRMWCRETKPTFLIEPELVRGDLVPVLCDFQPRQFDIVALYAAAIRAAARARFIDRLVEALGGDDPPWDRRRQQGLI
jgi:DNA-binding transcriptional LysR family regulator